MIQARQHTRLPYTRVVAAVAAAVVTTAVAGCTGGDDPTVPTAGGTPSTTVTTGEDPHAQELEFVACMREEGIADMPDPVPGDTSGRSSVRYALDVMAKGSDPAFQAALDKCMSLLPPPPPPEPDTPDEVEAKNEFARCMRDNGLSDFPDPQGDDWGFTLVVGDHSDPMPATTIVDGLLVLNLADPVVKAAWEVCQQHLPSND